MNYKKLKAPSSNGAAKYLEMILLNYWRNAMPINQTLLRISVHHNDRLSTTWWKASAEPSDRDDVKLHVADLEINELKQEQLQCRNTIV